MRLKHIKISVEMNDEQYRELFDQILWYIYTLNLKDFSMYVLPDQSRRKNNA